jgi:2-oxoglutarate ferredoxin oxidoreductase subunit beta
MMNFYKERSEIKNGADTKSVALGFQEKIIVGKFVDIVRPTYTETMNQYLKQKLGEDYVPLQS